ncbi:MAG: tRNA preQ1(34) S-adenosylmethionine ribosyltransferase-isomerase QueA [Spirochaeta sp.]|nr:tRNA preQ1(34) S-adenosylmethionine ribosyltransferase-isomerase QueA [Spirochaeta sp.]
MKTSDFFFELPPELIAQEPSGVRGESRLMVVDRETGVRRDASVRDICDYVPAGSVMVFNNSRVRKARVYATLSASDTVREFLLVRRTAANRWLAIGKNIMRLSTGRVLHFPAGVQATVGTVVEPYREIVFDREIDDTWLDLNGHVPLPPYIRRPDNTTDDERYQTVYAETTGSVAAPTAGLHFTPELLAALRDHGVQIQFVTLHVGVGTFLPVRTAEVEAHHMHEEEYHVSQETAAAVTRAVHDGTPVVAVGTTAVRTLESAWDATTGELRDGHRATDLFIYPGYHFHVVRHMFTNFHTPESSLVVLVSAFAGRELILGSYAEAVEKRYRFFSYGDAMLIL